MLRQCCCGQLPGETVGPSNEILVLLVSCHQRLQDKGRAALHATPKRTLHARWCQAWNFGLRPKAEWPMRVWSERASCNLKT